MKPKWNNPQDPYFRDDYPHILLTIENAHVLSNHYDKRTLDLLDTLILRTFNFNGYWKHFPIVLEHTDAEFFNYRLPDLMSE